MSWKRVVVKSREPWIWILHWNACSWTSFLISLKLNFLISKMGWECLINKIVYVASSLVVWKFWFHTFTTLSQVQSRVGEVRSCKLHVKKEKKKKKVKHMKMLDREQVLDCCCSVAQACPTPCDPMDCSLQGSSVPGILQAGILEWVAIPFSGGPSWPSVSCIGRQTLYCCATWEASYWSIVDLQCCVSFRCTF